MNWMHIAQQLAGVLIALAILVVPFMLGGFFARRLRMPDQGWRIGLCFLLLVGSISLLWHYRKQVKLGIDLSGGVTLIYEVDQEKKKQQGVTAVDMNELLAAVARRVNPGGQKEVSIRQYGHEQVEIIIPNATEEEVEQLELTLGQAGSLAFRILATRRTDEALVDQALAEQGDVVKEKDSGKIIGYWFPVQKEREEEFANRNECVTRTKKHGNKTELQVLVKKDEYDVTGAYLTRASRGMGQDGYPEVDFTFNSAGGALFGQLTSDNLPDPAQPQFKRQLGIILDNYLYSAPNIQSAIYESGRITGRFSDVEVNALVNVLNAGKLPAALSERPITKMYSGPLLGADTIRRSRDALLIAAVLVPLFMLWYYRFAGLVADIALILNMLFLVAVMISVKAAFTLTGLAGLALTIGMAVDNNVLIYERLREELEHGAAMRMAIRNAFSRASATIVDSNLTTLIAAIVLYAIGSDQVRGFAVALGLGVSISMFTAVFVARVIMDIAEKHQWRVLMKMKMRHLIHSTKIDFMRLFPYTVTASILLTVMAIVVSFARGKNLLDIDFTGGVSVQVVFKQPKEIDAVRASLATFDPEATVTNVQVTGEPAGKRFVLNSAKVIEVNGKDETLEAVEKFLIQTFAGELETNSVAVEKLATIEAAKPAAPASGAATSAPAAKPETPAPQKDAAPAGKAAPEKPGAPAGNKQSRSDLPSDNLLAYSEEVALLLADAASDAKAPAAAAPAKPAAKAEAKPEPKAETKPAVKPDAKPEAKAEPKPEAKPEAQPATPPADAAAPDPFVGGTQFELKFSHGVNYTTVHGLLTQLLPKATSEPEKVGLSVFNAEYEPGQSRAYDNWTVKTQLPRDKAQLLVNEVQKQLAASPFFPASTAIGGAVASNTTWQAVYALVVSWACMIIYLWIRFQHPAFGLGAVVALIHDVFMMLGALALSVYLAGPLGFLLVEPFKINLPIIAAFLTIIGYSVNDTIVVFDRIREVRGKDPHCTAKMVNNSVNQTLGRTLLTSFTVFLVVVVLYLFGGQAVHGFAFALIVGVATGTYSSIYIASPIVLMILNRAAGRKVFQQSAE